MTTPAQSINCIACGAPLPAKGNLCLYCGRAFKTEAEAQPQTLSDEIADLQEPAPVQTIWEPIPEEPLRPRATPLKPAFWITFGLVAIAIFCACITMGLLAAFRSG